MLDKQIVQDAVNKAISVFEHYFLVKMEINVGTQSIMVFLDADGGGVRIDELAKLNRSIRDILEKEEAYQDGNYSLEVSSYGLEKPLLLHRQYYKNIGRWLRVTTNEEDVVVGVLKHVDDDKIGLGVPPKHKKKDKEKEVEVLFGDIKSAYIEIKF